MDYETRMGMYAYTLDGVFNHGKVEGSPDNSEIEWVVDPAAESCADCLDIAEKGPYTKDTLPCSPGDGTTSCKSRCRCHLEIKPMEKTAQAMLIGGLRPPSIPAGLRLPTRAEYNQISQIHAQIDVVNAMIDTAEGARKKELIQQYRDLVHQRVDIMKQGGIYYVRGSNYIQPESSVEEALDLPKKYLPEGYRSPSEKEKGKIDEMAGEIDDLRTQILAAPLAERKVLIRKRYELAEQNDRLHGAT